MGTIERGCLLGGILRLGEQGASFSENPKWGCSPGAKVRGVGNRLGGQLFRGWGPKKDAADNKNTNGNRPGGRDFRLPENPKWGCSPTAKIRMVEID